MLPTGSHLLGGVVEWLGNDFAGQPPQAVSL